MLLPGSFSAALAAMVAAMVFWGSWTNTYRLTRKWRLELFHCDYSIGVFLIAWMAAATGGMLFGAPNFLDNLRGANAGLMAIAVVAGVAVNCGNLLFMEGIARVGMAVAFPISVGLTLVVSTTLSYAIHPLGDPLLLASGAALVFCAVLANAFAYRSMGSRKGAGSRGGLAMCFAAAALFSIAGPLIAKVLAPPRPLSPYGASALYATGCLIAAGFLLPYLLRRPIGGVPLSMKLYAAGTARDHAAGLAGGAIWGVAALCNMLAAGFAGMAVAGAVGQASPLVAAIWGIAVWKEFRGASARTLFLLALMILLYSAGLVLLGRSFRGV